MSIVAAIRIRKTQPTPKPERISNMQTSANPSAVSQEALDLLKQLGAVPSFDTAGSLIARSPIDGAIIGRLRPASGDDVRSAIARAHAAFLAWRAVPAPRRGELVRLLGEELRKSKDALGHLVTIE